MRTHRGVIRTLLAVLALALAPTVLNAPAAGAAGLGEVTGFGSNPGNLRMVTYVPPGLVAGRPVVVALHGCGQSGASYGENSGWTQLADRWKFALVLPQQQLLNNPALCFNWFNGGDSSRDRGEAASVSQMTQRMIADTGADRNRVYVTGLSAGAGLTSAMLGSYPEVYAGGAVVAGVPFGCASDAAQGVACQIPGINRSPKEWGDRVRAATGHTGRWPTVSIWHGTWDTVVAPRNQAESVDQWTDVHGTDTTPDTRDTVAGYPHAVYRDAGGAPVVQTYTIPGMGHGQSVNPGTGDGQCGGIGTFFPDFGICTAWRIGQDWGLAS